MDVHKEFEQWRTSSCDYPEIMTPNQIRQLELAFIAGMHVRNLHILTIPDFQTCHDKLETRLRELGLKV